MDYAEPYLRFILGFLGLTDVTTYRIEGRGDSRRDGDGRTKRVGKRLRLSFVSKKFHSPLLNNFNKGE
jgi:hypothetical protein